MDPVEDYSRLDAYAAARRRAALARELWKPVLAGAVASLAVSGAVWTVLPRFSVREVVVDRVVQRDVTADHVIPREVPIDIPIPNVVTKEVEVSIPRAVAAPRSPEEFENSQPFRDATVKGRYAGPSLNGFKLDSGQTFYPARYANGKVELAADALDDVSHLSIGDPVYCAPTAPEGLFSCRAWHSGRIEDIVAIPVARRS